MEVLIVGAGTMGRWFASAVDASVAFADVDPDAAAEAAEAVGGRAVALDGAEAFDAVCLAVPMGLIEEAIERHAPRAERAVLDVSGVMAPAIGAMEAHASDRERLSLHPLFAPDRAPGSVPYVAANPGSVTDSILAALEARGNDLIETTPAEHDAAMESVQAAAHAAVLSFALAADRAPEGFETPIYAGISELAERLTGGSPRVYADIQRTFDGAAAVADAAAELASADGAEFDALYREAAAEWDQGESDRGLNGTEAAESSAPESNDASRTESADADGIESADASRHESDAAGGGAGSEDDRPGGR